MIVFPPKLIVTGFGTILGMSGSEISSGAGVISTLNGKISNIAKEIDVVAANLGASPDVFLTQTVWLYIGIVAVSCLPAFSDKYGA